MPSLKNTEQEFLNNFKNKLSGRTILIASCGPSLQHWQEIYENIKHKDPYVICIKQAIDQLQDICDMHILNVFNARRYRYSKNTPYRILGTSEHDVECFCPYDISYRVIQDQKESDNLVNSLAGSYNFDNYKISKTGMQNRPWGPGVMYEFVFPFLVECDVDEIITVGWDIADNNGKNTHFYDKKSFSPKIKKWSLYGTLSRLIKHTVGKKYANLFLHYSNQKYNLAGMQTNEAIYIQNSVPKLQKWIDSYNIKLTINSDSQWLT